MLVSYDDLYMLTLLYNRVHRPYNVGLQLLLFEDKKYYSIPVGITVFRYIIVEYFLICASLAARRRRGWSRTDSICECKHGLRDTDLYLEGRGASH